MPGLYDNRPSIVDSRHLSIDEQFAAAAAADAARMQSFYYQVSQLPIYSSAQLMSSATVGPPSDQIDTTMPAGALTQTVKPKRSFRQVLSGFIPRKITDKNAWKNLTPEGMSTKEYMNSPNKFGISKKANPFSKGNIQSGASTGLINAAAGAINTFGNKWLSEGYEGAGKTIGSVGSTVGGLVSQYNPLLGGAISAASGIVGGLANRFLGMKTNREALGIANKNIQRNMSFRSNAQSFDSLQEAPGVQGHAKVYKGGHWNKRAGNKKNAALAQAEGFAAQSAVNQVNSNIENLQHKQANTMLQNYSAYGGPLDGAIGYQFMSDYLNNGKLKAMGSETMTQMPNSFMNMNAFGGNIEAHGSNWSTGLSHINKGGTHEENPYGGVTVGHDDQGVPNMVEEGETIANTKKFGSKVVRDYVFSDRLTVPEYSKQYKKEEMPYEMKVLKKYEGKSFSKGGKMAEKRSGVDERPNDILAQNMFTNDAYYLMTAQEKEREKQELEELIKQIDMMSPEELQDFQQRLSMAMQGPSPDEMAAMQQQMAMQQPSPEEQQMMMQQQGGYPEGQEMSPEEQQMMMAQQQDAMPQDAMFETPEQMAAYGGYVRKMGGPLRKFDGGGDLITESSFRKLYKSTGLTIPYKQAYKQFMSKGTTQEAWNWLVGHFGEALYKDVVGANAANQYLKEGWRDSLQYKTDVDALSHSTNFLKGGDNLLNVLAANWDKTYSNPSGDLMSEATLKRLINKAERLYKQDPDKFEQVFGKYGVSTPLELYNTAYRYYKDAKDWKSKNNFDLEAGKADYIKAAFKRARGNGWTDEQIQELAGKMFPNFKDYFKTYTGDSLIDEILAKSKQQNGGKDTTADLIGRINQYATPEAKLADGITTIARDKLNDTFKYNDKFADIYGDWNYGGKQDIEYKPSADGKTYAILPWLKDGKVSWRFNDEDFEGDMYDYEKSEGYLSPRYQLAKKYYDAEQQAIKEGRQFDRDAFFQNDEDWKSYIASLDAQDNNYWNQRKEHFTLQNLFGKDTNLGDILKDYNSFKTWANSLQGPINSSYWFDRKAGIAHGLASKVNTPGGRTIYFSGGEGGTPYNHESAIFYSDNPGSDWITDKEYSVKDGDGHTTKYIRVKNKNGSPLTFDEYDAAKAALDANPLIWENGKGKLPREDMPLPELPTYPYLAAAALQAGLLGYNLLDSPDLSDTARLLSMAENVPYKPVGWNNVPDTFDYRPVNARAVMQPVYQADLEAWRRFQDLSTAQGAARAALANQRNNTINKAGQTYLTAMQQNEENRQKAFGLSQQAGLQNSEGALKADIDNAKNFSTANTNSLTAMNAAITNKQKILDDKSKSISSSLSGLVNTLPAWAQQKYQGDMLAWGAYHNAWPGAKTLSMMTDDEIDNWQRKRSNSSNA